MGQIRINQMGYSPNGIKQVVYTGNATEFQIFRSEDRQIVYTGELKEKGFDKISGEELSSGDFSSFNESGVYYIKVNNECSRMFVISKEQYGICTRALLKAFYFQRCGVELTEEFAGEWKHPACHLQPSYLFEQNAEALLERSPKEMVELDTLGGWHDAGDYGRYTIANVKTIADLLLAYELFGEVFQENTGIPESKQPGVDLLHEVKVGLDFLFKMQRKSDGAVYTKVATRYFPGMIMPELDKEPLFVFDISSPATAGFAAVMAMASKAYEKFDADYAKQCLEAAKLAYSWLQLNPEPLLFKNPANITSGEYGDDNDIDERYWAAAQLYRTTEEELYHNDFLMYHFMLKDEISLGWRSVGGYGTIAYFLTEHSINSEVYDTLKKEWLCHAIELEQRSHEDGYGITLVKYQYVWGSNMILMNQAMHLIVANHLLMKHLYDEMIHRNWDYLFGMNAMDLSYVTGLGEAAVKNPHHRPSEADGVADPVPGLVSGGPCASLIDEVVKNTCKGQPPAKCFADDVESYSSNEIDIYWNSPAVFVGAYLTSIYAI